MHHTIPKNILHKVVDTNLGFSVRCFDRSHCLHAGEQGLRFHDTGAVTLPRDRFIGMVATQGGIVIEGRQVVERMLERAKKAVDFREAIEAEEDSDLENKIDDLEEILRVMDLAA